MSAIQDIKSILSSPKKVITTMHASPDADALGSSLGWHHFLTKLGHDSVVISPTEYPSFLSWMKGNDEVIEFSDDTLSEVTDHFNNADIVFCLDFSGVKRVRDMERLLVESNAIKVVMDHHQNPEPFYDYLIHDTAAAATAELIYDLINEFDPSYFDGDIADCLYAGLMTDTGSFKHSNTTPKVFRTAAGLIEHGARASFVSQSIYDNNSLNRLRFLGYALNQLLVVMPENNTAYFTISNETYEKYQLESGDTEGLVNYALSIKGIKIAALFKQKGNEVKISFRSVGDIAVNIFAESYFEGGGHRNAAGGRSSDSLQNTVAKFESLIREEQLILA